MHRGDDVQEYVSGQKVQPRKFSFKEGRGYILTDPKHARQLGDREFVIVEGIHGLNPIFGEKSMFGMTMQMIFSWT